MRSALLLALALLCAGCITSSNAPNVTPSSLAEGGGWTLDCTLGSWERMNASWAQDCEARASHTAGPKQEIWLAVNPKDPGNVIIGAKDLNPDSSAQCVWNGVFVTHDMGRHWKDVVIGGKYSERTPDSPYFGYACNTDPMLAFSKDGTAHYVVEMYNLLGQDSHGPLGPDPLAGRALLLPGWKLQLATSHDGGDTWPDSTTLEVGDGIAAINDYSRIAVSPTSGAILTIINTFSGGPFILAGAAYTFCSVDASRDNGASADLPVLVTGDPTTFNPAAEDPANPSAPNASFGCQAIAIAPDGTVVVAGGGPTTQWSWSKDDGKSFTAPVPGFHYQPIRGVFNESKYRTGTNFELAYAQAGPNKGTLYAIYADGSRGNADIYARSSKDNGHTWGNATRVNDDAGDHNQFNCNIAVADDGTLHAFFMDKRWDPANKLIDITHAWSTDNGQTWRNERVTNMSFDGDLGKHQEGFPFIGDYIGIGQSQNHVWGAFPDASNGNATVVAAAHVHPAGA